MLVSSPDAAIQSAERDVFNSDASRGDTFVAVADQVYDRIRRDRAHVSDAIGEALCFRDPNRDVVAGAAIAAFLAGDDLEFCRLLRGAADVELRKEAARQADVMMRELT